MVDVECAKCHKEVPYVVLPDDGTKLGVCMECAGDGIHQITRMSKNEKWRNPIQLAPALNYTPRGDRVIIKRLPPPIQKPGETIIPGSQQRQLNEGTVMAVGPGLRNRVTGKIDPIELAIGAHVCFVEHAGYDVDVDGETYLQMADSEVIGIRG